MMYAPSLGRPDAIIMIASACEPVKAAVGHKRSPDEPGFGREGDWVIELKLP